MPVSAAITVNVSPTAVSDRLSAAEPPLNDPDHMKISTRPAPGDRGAEIRAVWDAKHAAGVGRALAAITGDDPQRQLDDALRRFKQLIETGVIVRSDASPDGIDARAQRRQSRAQPADPDD